MNWIEADWPAPAGVHAVSTLRTGGVSQGQYASFNLAMHVADNVEDVAHNRQQLRQKLQLPGEPVWLQQVHGKHVIKADPMRINQQADASYSDQAGVVCTVMTADCLPLLMTANDGSKIAAVHAGWRGLLAGVIEHTVAALNTTHIMVWMGPAIGPHCFEVGEDVRRAFMHKSAEFAQAFSPHAQNKYLLDIYRLARQILEKQGVNKIFGGNYCTLSDEEKFFSYRRDGVTGRMASLIWRE